MSSDDLCSTRKMDIIVIDQVHVYINKDILGHLTNKDTRALIHGPNSISVHTF